MDDTTFRAPQFGKYRPKGSSAARSCYTKTRYATEEYAIKVMNKRLAAGAETLRVYACYRCGGYHLTRRPD